MEQFEFEKYSRNGWRGFVRSGWSFDDVDAWLEEGSSEVILDALCRKVRRHRTEKGVVYSKLMWAQNDQAIREGLPHKWLKWAFGRSRAVLILKTTSLMTAMGHLCPEPLLAVRKLRANGWHLNLLVTREVSGKTLEEEVLHGAGEAAVVRAGRELALLHKDGFVHGDFLPRNTMLDGDRFFFLDNDKSAHRGFFFLQRRNLDQFTYNLMYLMGTDSCHHELPMAFLESYASTAQWGEERKQAEFARILAKAEKRWQNEACRMGKK